MRFTNNNFFAAGPLDSNAPADLNTFYLGQTNVSLIDQERNIIYYRGYNTKSLLKECSFEECLFLLLYGSLPSTDQLLTMDFELRSHRNLTPDTIDLIYNLRACHPFDVLKTVISFIGSKEKSNDALLKENLFNDGLKLIAKIPTVLATLHRIREGKTIIKPDSLLSHTQNFLFMFQGRKPNEEHVSILERMLIVHAEHGIDISTLAAQLAISAQTNVFEAFTASLSIFPGKLQGGAIEDLLNLVNEIKHESCVKQKVEELISLGREVPGFENTISKLKDPRIFLLKEMMEDLVRQTKKIEEANIVNKLVFEMNESLQSGSNPRIELYSGVCYRLLGFADDMATALSFAGRSAGILAHITEQNENKLRFHPVLQYDGPIHSGPIPRRKPK